MEAQYQEILNRYSKNRNGFQRAMKELKKAKKNLDQDFAAAHDRVFNVIDCLKCARCCRELGPLLKDRDIKRLAKENRMKEGDFTQEYLYLDDEGDFVFKEIPCPFLDNQWYCIFYDQRPQACREYPHTDQKKMNKRLNNLKKDCSYCPAAVMILEQICQERGIQIV